MAAQAETTPEKRRPRFDMSLLADPVSMQSARKWAAEVGQRVIVELALDVVVEDPDNPRTRFLQQLSTEDQEALRRLADSIKVRGVMQPILVRERNADGVHTVIQGARRYRGSQLAGKATIPAIVIPTAELDLYDDYSQVIENVQRQNLNAEEMCAFIVKRLAKGDKKGEIAEKLGIGPKAISAYLAIKDLSENVRALFRAGKIDGIEPLYDLTRLQAKAPALAARLIADAEQSDWGEITLAVIRRAIKDAEQSPSAEPQSGDGNAQFQNTQSTPAANGAGAQVGEGLGSQTVSTDSKDELSGVAASTATSPPTLGQSQDDGDGIHSRKGDSDDKDEERVTELPGTVQLPYHNPDAHKPSGSGDGRMPDPNHIKKPLLLGQIDGESVKILLTRRPTSPGLVHVSWESTGIEEEVSLDRITLTLLSDMKVQETA